MNPTNKKVGHLKAAERRLKVLKMRRAGNFHSVIAKAVGITAQRVSQIITAEYKSLDEKRADQAKECLQLDLERLDALTLAHWDNAINGDLPAGEFILKLIYRRSRILGYDMQEMIPQQLGKVMFVTHEESNEPKWADKARAEQERKAG